MISNIDLYAKKLNFPYRKASEYKTICGGIISIIIIIWIGIQFLVWGLGIGPNPQSPIPNPQSPIPNPQIRVKMLCI